MRSSTRQGLAMLELVSVSLRCLAKTACQAMRTAARTYSMTIRGVARPWFLMTLSKTLPGVA